MAECICATQLRMFPDVIAEFHEYLLDLSIKFAVILTEILLLSHNFLRIRFRHELWNCGTLCKFHSVNFLTPVRQIERYYRRNYFSRCYSKRATRLSGDRCGTSVKSRRCNQTGLQHAACYIVFAKGVKGRAVGRIVFAERKLSRIKSRPQVAFNGRRKQIPRRYFSFPSEKEQRGVSLQSIYPSGCHQYRANVDRLLQPDSRNTNGAAILP